MRIQAGRLDIDAATDGRVVAVWARRRPKELLVTLVDLGACRVAGADVGWGPREVAFDTDEIWIGTRAGGLQVELRHSFTSDWTTRLLVVNPGAAALTLDRLELVARPASRQRLSALAAGSRLCWAVQTAAGEGPLLVARLTAGAVSGVTENGLELGALRLAPGQRYVIQLRWELVATPRSVVAGPGRDVLVTRTVYETGEPVLLPADPDAALVAPRDVLVDPVEDSEASGQELTAADPGRRRIELRSADGDVRLDLSWVRPLPVQLGVWATSVLSRPRTGAGVVAVDDLPAAIVLQAALGTGGSDVDQAGDALDRLTGRLIEDPELHHSPLAVLYLLGEHSRTGDDDALTAAVARATDLLDRDGPPPPGLGLTVLRSALASVDLGERVAPLVRRAVRRATGAVNDSDTRPMSTPTDDTGVGWAAAELELLLAVRPLLSGDHPAQQRLVALVRELGATLGSGLPGRQVSLPPVAEHAHVVAVLQMLPEDGLPDVTRTWGSTTDRLAHRWTLEVLDRLTDADIGPAAAWLVLAQRHA